MIPKMAILVLPATAVVVGLVFHSLKFRGLRETLYFFIFALLFGVARGNIIYYITVVLFEGKFPYIFQNKLLGLYHDSLTADFGWIICLYIGSYMAFRIADRLPGIKGKVFPTISLACLFNVCLSYAVEATAMTMDWWQWNLSTKSSILSDVPMAGIVAWFSVGFDFLVPYFLIRHYRRPGQWWPFLTVLIFPVHMATHMFNTRISGLVPITPYNIFHWGMVLAVIVLPFASALKFRTPWLPEEALSGRGAARKGRTAAAPFLQNMPLFGLAVVASVLIISDLGITRSPGLLISKVPLLFYTLLAVHRVPAAAVAGAAVLSAMAGGILFVPPMIVPAFYVALWAKSLWGRMPWLKLVYILIPLVLTGWYYSWSRAKDEVDMRYAALCKNGVALAENKDLDGAIREFTAAAEMKPYSLAAYQNLGILYSRQKQYDKAEIALKKILELRPISDEARVNLGNLYILKNDLDEAEKWFNEALKIDPDDAYSRHMLEEIDRLRKSARSRTLQP
jgi:predicted negative regulator of RcsB-dependent stress response